MARLDISGLSPSGGSSNTNSRRVASKKERKILACILNIREGVEDGNELKWM